VDFNGIPVGAFGYDLFWTYCLTNSITIFLTAGVVNITPLTGYSSFWAILSGMTGATSIGIVLATATSRLQRRKKKIIRNKIPPSQIRTYTQRPTI